MSALRGLWGAFRPRPRAPALILMYHRIARSPVDPWNLCVSPENFDAQLAWLSRNCRVTSVRELVNELSSGEIPERTVAITFDDGYADNLLAGEPLLRKHGLPATFFLTTTTLGAEREFWWDELEGLLLREDALPAAIELNIDRQTQTFSTRSAAASWDLSRESHNVRPWEAAADTRIGFFYSVWKSLRPLQEGARREALASIRQQLGVSQSTREAYRTLTFAEAKQLAASPEVHIGAHSVTHASFSYRSEDEQRAEMQQSKSDLEQLIGRPVPGFAYPYGDYGSESARIAAEVGFEFACTTESKRITPTTPAHLMPRLAVEDWEERAFARFVRRFLG
jgi:peptidoglycan/xylan/chitin deacetylase (PgdA/CDA1 family)